MRLLVFATLITGALPGAALYSDKATFQAQLGSTVTDDYANPGYQFINSDANMTAVRNETQYTTTGFTNLNIVYLQYYCAGCNGSFRLTFTSTSVGNALGVYGAGLNIVGNSEAPSYHAFVTFGDGSTANHALPVVAFGDLSAPTFWGITSPLGIRSIHFGLENGGATMAGSFGIDNLTIGSSAVPEPSTMVIGASALAALWLRRRR